MGLPNPVEAAYMGEVTWTPLRSSNVAAAAYLDSFGWMYVRFKNGNVYRYTCPKGIYQGLLSAPSAGTYIWSVVRAKGTDSAYDVKRVV